MTEEHIKRLSSATDTLEESLRETIESLQDILTVLQEWNEELEILAKDFE